MKMKNTNSRNKLSKFLALGCACAVVVGSFAYFTDRVYLDSPFEIAISDNPIDIKPIDPENPNPTPDPDPGKEIEWIWNQNNPDLPGPTAPGDSADLGWTLENNSESAIDVRETFVLTSSVALDQTNPEYRLFLDQTADQYGAAVGGTVVATEEISEFAVKYTIAPFTLNGAGDEGEKVTGGVESKAMDYHVVFDKYASNAFQGSTCDIDYVIEMKQHSADGPDGGWVEAATANITLGGESVAVVPNASGQ